mgnify:CR=1 FL=1
MKVKDIIKDDKFNEFLGYEIEAYNNRPAPQEGYRYVFVSVPGLFTGL